MDRRTTARKDTPMKTLKLAAITLWLTAFAAPALACACEIECKPGEIYSDSAEMCVPDVNA